MLNSFIAGITGALGTATLLGLAGYLFRHLIVERLRASINHEYDKIMFELSSQREARIKSELVAELLSEWIRQDKQDFARLNKLSFQAFLWLPENIANDLSNTLAHQEGAQNIRLLLKQVRTHIQGKEDDFAAENFIEFNAKSSRNQSSSTDPADVAR